MDAGAMQAAAAASAASYRSFAEATRSVLDLVAAQLPDATVFLAHLDRTQDLHRIVDVRNGEAFELRANLAVPLGDSLDIRMADRRAPGRCDDVAGHPVLGGAAAGEHLGAASYLGAAVELSDGSRVGALTALSREEGRFGTEHEQLFGMLARVLAHELERETNQRDVRRLNEALRVQARGLAAVARAAREVSTGTDARQAICEAAAAAVGAPVAFLLEPERRELVSTAMHGVDIAPVTIQAREATGGPHGVARAFSSLERYFVPDATDHPALARPLVEATGARSALFQPVVRDDLVIGVLILIWREPIAPPSESAASVLRLVAAQAAVAVEHARLHGRLADLALTDTLTGVPTRRAWDQEVPRELARARRQETPMCVGLLDLDHLADFNGLRGMAEGDRLLKETAAAWTSALREIDTLARLEGGRFGILLPGCTTGEACDVLDRLRALTPRSQTASGGVARWNGEEPAELLEARARAALAQAKAAGRDMTLAAE